MRRVWLLALVLGCDSFGSGVQGSGVAGAEDRTVAAFMRIEQAGSADLDVEVGAPQRVRVESDDNLLPLIETRTVEGTLRISSTKNYSAKTGVLVKAAAPVIEAVTVAGAGDVKASGIAGEKFVASIKGAGDMTLGGAVKELEVSVNGSGDVDASGIAAARVVVRISGSGDVKVTASERVEAHISGSGSVRYGGGAKEVVKDVSGSGSVEPM